MQEKAFEAGDEIVNRDTEWGTYDGRSIPIRDLENNHVLNIYLHLNRRLEKYRKELDFYKEEYDLSKDPSDDMMVRIKQDKLEIVIAMINLIDQEINIRKLDRSKITSGKSLPFKKDGVWMEWKEGEPLPTPIPNSILFIKPLEDDN